MSQPISIDPQQARRNSRFAYVGGAIALTGVQMIAPSLPVMRDALGLDGAQIALVMSIYLLPAAVFSVPAGMLADRVGRRLVFGLAFIGFGISGVFLPLLGGSFTAFLAVRFVQGVFFAGLLPLTMTILGDAFRGHALVRAHGRRLVALSLSDGSFPVIGGLLVGAGWWVPWLGQTLGIPFGMAVLVGLVDPQGARSTERTAVKIPKLMRLFREVPILSLQYVGFLRIFLKFSILTFLPVFLVDVRDQSPAFAGLAVGIAALTGAAVVILSDRLARLGSVTMWIAAGTTLMGLSLVTWVLVPTSGAIIAVGIVFGAADGVTGVFVNSLVTVATGADQRASFVAATGAMRNFAKFMAPAAFGALLLAVPITSAFVIAGGVTLVSGASVAGLRPLERRLIRQDDA